MVWRNYKNLARNSPVTKYFIGDNFIRIIFGRGGGGGFDMVKRYQWTAYYIGQGMIDEMKRLAENGRGLFTYVNSHRLRHQVARVY